MLLVFILVIIAFAVVVGTILLGVSAMRHQRHRPQPHHSNIFGEQGWLHLKKP
jgi:hypothetical protein